MRTDIEAIRLTTKAIFDSLKVEPVKGFEKLGICIHPFTNNSISFDNKNGRMLDLTKPDDFSYWRSIMFDIIDKQSISGLFCMVSTAWKMTWFKYVCNNLDKKDYAEFLKMCWTEQDNPNQDVNVSLKEAIEFFQAADKNLLMDEEELEHYNSLPDKVTVYRGVSPGREQFGLSWTDEKEKAIWFKKRFEHDNAEGYLLTATIPKKYILAYLDVRNEKELVVDVFQIKEYISKAQNVA